MSEERRYRMKANKGTPGFRKEICKILYQFGSSVMIEFYSGDTMTTNFNNLVEVDWYPAPDWWEERGL